MQNKSERGEMNRGVFLPEDEVFGLLWYRHFWRKDQCLSPVHHFPVCLLRRLWAERRVTCRQGEQQTRPTFVNLVWNTWQWILFSYVPVITYQHLIHDDTKAPPIAELVVSILHEDLWSNVVWGPHCGESLTTRRRRKLEVVCFEVTLKTHQGKTIMWNK